MKINYKIKQDFKVGDKVQVISKSIGCDLSVSLGNLKRNNENKYSYIIRIDKEEDMDRYVVWKSNEVKSGDHYLKQDLELYEGPDS